MARKTYKGLIALTLILSFIAHVASPSHAGVLNGNASAVTFSSFSGTGSFLSGSLAGDLDYAVFTAAEFSAAFPLSPYSPLGAVVYAYQLENTGIAAISAQIIGVSNPVSGDIDSFLNSAGEVSPSSQLFSSGNPLWSFGTPNLLNAEFSEILVFSSPNSPMSGAGLTINGGTSALLSGVPTPSATAIPEPSSVCLAAAGMLALFLRRKKQA